MKRSFLIGVSWSNRNSNGFMNYHCNFENRGFRRSDVKEVEQRCEDELFRVYGQKAEAVVLHVSEMEPEE